MLLSGLYSFVLIHNHPDGQLFPIDNDINNYYISGIAKMLDYECVDSLIITKDGWYSIKTKRFIMNKNHFDLNDPPKMGCSSKWCIVQLN